MRSISRLIEREVINSHDDDDEGVFLAECEIRRTDRGRLEGY